MYRVFPDNIEMEAEVEHFPWYMPDWCSIEGTQSLHPLIKLSTQCSNVFM